MIHYMKSPHGYTSVSVAGHDEVIAVDGVFAISEALLPHVVGKPFFFETVRVEAGEEKPEKDEFDGMKKSELQDWLDERDLNWEAVDTKEVLLQRCRQAVPKQE